MKKNNYKSLVLICSLAITFSYPLYELSARGGRGGGGARGGASRGGASRGGASRSRSRPSAGRTPSMSRPSPSRRPSSRPSSRPSRPSSRPSSKPSSRPSRPNSRPSTRPSTRPSQGTRPGSRPSTRPSQGTRPTRPSGNKGRPSQRDLNNFLDFSKRPSSGKRPVIGGGGSAIGGAVGGAAVADFLNNRPSTGQRPSTRPANPSTRPDRPSTQPVPGDRPGGGDRPNRPGDGNGDRPNRPNRPGDGDGDRPNRPNRPGDGDGNRPNRPNRPGDGIGNLPNRPNRPGNGNRPNRPNRPRPPRPPHWDFHKHHPHYARWNWNRPYRWATWAGLAAFFPWSTGGQEIYYNYGDNIYYENGEVYQDGQAIASTEEYAEQAQELATSAPEPTDDTEWMTLGVFAATAKDSDSGADPAFYLQLAVSKDGIIAGTVHMSETDKTSTIEGMVDHKSQRAAWAMTGKKSPIMETGIANLTQDEATALLHFEDGTTQQWTLIRLEEPEEDKKK